MSPAARESVRIALDRSGARIEHWLDVPRRLLARQFRSRSAFRRYVIGKVERAEERERARRIAAIFEAATASKLRKANV